MATPLVSIFRLSMCTVLASTVPVISTKSPMFAFAADGFATISSLR